MRNFTIAALAAAIASAEYQELTIKVDGNEDVKHFKSQSWSSVTQSNVGSVNVANNNNIFIKQNPFDDTNDTSYAMKPYIRGGAVSFDVDLSSVDCGCVAGVYAVTANPQIGCGEGDMNGYNPMCPTIDIMQANPYGFNTAAHPCANGTCDAVSQCQYNMAVEGKAQYGENAYGPGGSMVNTDYPFNVKTEFLSHNSYQDLWGLRTRLTRRSLHYGRPRQ